MRKQLYTLFFFLAFCAIAKSQNYAKLDSLLHHGAYSDAKIFFEKKVYKTNNQDSTYLYCFIKSSSFYVALEQVTKSDSLLSYIEPSLQNYSNNNFLYGTFYAEKANVLLKQRKFAEIGRAHV